MSKIGHAYLEKARVKTAEKKVKFSHYSKFADKIRQAFSML